VQGHYLFFSISILFIFSKSLEHVLPLLLKEKRRKHRERGAVCVDGPEVMSGGQQKRRELPRWGP